MASRFARLGPGTPDSSRRTARGLRLAASQRSRQLSALLGESSDVRDGICGEGVGRRSHLRRMPCPFWRYFLTVGAVLIAALLAMSAISSSPRSSRAGAQSRRSTRRRRRSDIRAAHPSPLSRLRRNRRRSTCAPPHADEAGQATKQSSFASGDDACGTRRAMAAITC